MKTIGSGDMLRWTVLSVWLAGCASPAVPEDTADPDTADTDTGLSDPVDADQDGFTVDEDCDDDDPTRFPGADERCNQVDDDCDGEVDEDPVDPSTWHYDADSDSYGSSGETVVACSAPAGFVASADDCDDADPEVHPAAEEICFDGVDNDCAPNPDDCELIGTIDADFPVMVESDRSDVVRLVDVDGDRYLDVFIVEGGSTSLRLGPAPEFGPARWSLPGRVRTVGDLDGDGHLDVVLARAGGRDPIVWGPLDRAGPDTSQPLPSGLIVTMALDANGDGQLDLVGHPDGGGEPVVWFGPIARDGVDRPADVVVEGAIGAWREQADIARGPGDDLVVVAEVDGELVEVLVALDRPVVDVSVLGMVVDPQLVSVPDMNGDGRAELCFATELDIRYVPGPWFEGKQAAPILVERGQPCGDPVTHDVDRDGILDVVIGGNFGPRMYRGPFKDVTAWRDPDLTVQAVGAMGPVAFEDIDGDGIDDWLIPARPFRGGSSSTALFLLDGLGK